MAEENQDQHQLVAFIRQHRTGETRKAAALSDQGT
jgi:hypothetical protein